MTVPQELSRAALHAEIVRLRQEIIELKREKADLEILIDTNIEHSDYITEELIHKAESTKKTLLAEIEKLRSEIVALRQEMSELQRAKADLELLIEMNTEHADYIEEDLLQKVETTLRESERRFRMISATIPIPILVSREADHVIVYANEPASALLGLSIEALLCNRVIDFYDPTVRQPLLDLLTSRGYVSHYELQGKKADGSPFWGALSAQSLIFNDEPCVLNALYDMTARKQAEHALQKLNEELEQRVEERTRALQEAYARIVKLEKETLEFQMAGGFAHEMRNALASVSIALEAVFENEKTLCEKNAALLGKIFDALEQKFPDEKWTELLGYFEEIEQNEAAIDEVLRIMGRSASSALHVTTLILNYAQLGRIEVGRERVKMQELLERIVQEHAAALAEQQITLRLKGTVIHMVRGHVPHFRLVLNNLILNARDALLEVTDDRVRVIEIALFEDAEKQVISVSDNANGIPEEYQSKIFEPFFSTKPTTGTGLGLSFVSKLTPMYNGTIVFESHIGKGTTFTVTFPIDPITA